MEIGIDRFLFNGASAPSGAGSNPVPDLLEEIDVAEASGVNIFSVGEHHTAEFADSSPAVLLAAAAGRTKRIRLGSAITILSVADPVRIMEDFATLDLVSNGRAEIVVGRGAYAEAFALFGNSFAQYAVLAEEKLPLLLQLRSGKPVTWRGKFRPALHAQVTTPRPVQALLPIWQGATGSAETFERAGRLGLPLAIGTIGGPFRQYRPLVDLYYEAGLHAGHKRESLKVAFHAIGFLADTAEEPRARFFPGYRSVFGDLGAKAGWPPITRERLDAMSGPGQSLFLGNSSEIAAKFAELDYELGGVSRVCLQMTVGPLEQSHRLEAIRLLGTVASRL